MCFAIASPTLKVAIQFGRDSTPTLFLLAQLQSMDQRLLPITPAVGRELHGGRRAGEIASMLDAVRTGPRRQISGEQFEKDIKRNFELIKSLGYGVLHFLNPNGGRHEILVEQEK